MADPRDALPLALHPFDILVRGATGVDRGLEAARGVVDGPSEAWADGEEARDERRDEVFTGTRGDDGVVGSRDARAVTFHFFIIFWCFDLLAFLVSWIGSKEGAKEVVEVAFDERGEGNRPPQKKWKKGGVSTWRRKTSLILSTLTALRAVRVEEENSPPRSKKNSPFL